MIPFESVPVLSCFSFRPDHLALISKIFPYAQGELGEESMLYLGNFNLDEISSDLDWLKKFHGRWILITQRPPQSNEPNHSEEW